MEVAKLGILYPKGLVQTYLFEERGKRYLFISSAGCDDNELKEYRKLNIDFLMVPLQGHSQIQRITAEITEKINPKVVIPHHHDDFYPPLSQEIPLESFNEELRRSSFKDKVIEIPLFQSAHL